MARVRGITRSLSLLVLLSACGTDDEPAFGVRWELGELLYHAREGDALACREALEHIARHRAGFAEFFALPSVESANLRYFKYRDPTDFRNAAGCPQASAACFDGSVHSALPVDYHELVHAWVRHGIDVYTPILSEGLATALSCSPLARRIAVGARVELDTSDVYGAGYQNAGLLVTQALRQGSMDSLFALVARADAGTRDEAAVREAFIEVYGQPVEELRDRAAAESAPSCFALGRCSSAAPLTLGTTRIQGSCEGVPGFILSAALGNAVGLRAVGWHLDALACAPDAKSYALRQTGIGDFEDSSGAEYFAETPQDPHLVTLSSRDAAPEAILVTRRLDGIFSPSCPSELSAELDPERPARLVVPHRPGELYFSFRLAEPRSLSITWVGDHDAAPLPGVARCQGCSADAGLSCGPLDVASGARTEAVQALVLRLEIGVQPPSGLLLEIR